jgi:hypothetical protein
MVLMRSMERHDNSMRAREWRHIWVRTFTNGNRWAGRARQHVRAYAFLRGMQCLPARNNASCTYRPVLFLQIAPDTHVSRPPSFDDKVSTIVLKIKPVRWFDQKKLEPKSSPIFLKSLVQLRKNQKNCIKIMCFLEKMILKPRTLLQILCIRPNTTFTTLSLWSTIKANTKYTIRC